MLNVLATTTIKLNGTEALLSYLSVWVICAVCGAIVIRAALRSPNFARWVTRDLFVVASLGVVLEVYDNIIGDQFVAPLLEPIPGLEQLQAHDLPYMFVLMVGVAIVRKPGCVTAMVFINYLLSQLLFGAGHGVLEWTDGLTQGLFCDVYIVARKGRVCAPGGSPIVLALDGLMIGALRAGPNAFFTNVSFDPYLEAEYHTVANTIFETWTNTLGNAVEAAISAGLAMRVAQSVIPGLGHARAPASDDGQSVLDAWQEREEGALASAGSVAALGAEGEAP